MSSFESAANYASSCSLRLDRITTGLYGEETSGCIVAGSPQWENGGSEARFYSLTFSGESNEV